MFRVFNEDENLSCPIGQDIFQNFLKAFSKTDKGNFSHRSTHFLSSVYSFSREEPCIFARIFVSPISFAG